MRTAARKRLATAVEGMYQGGPTNPTGRLGMSMNGFIRAPGVSVGQIGTGSKSA